VAITGINPTGAKVATVSAAAAVTVVVVNATRFHGGRASTDLGDDGRATAVTIFDTKQNVATLVTVGARAATSVVVMNATTITAVTPAEDRSMLQP
jgi:hypothetical protein